MNLLEASKLVSRDHVYEAIERLEPYEDYQWLYEQTGRREPDHRYIVVEGQRYPSKAFGFLVAQIAGKTDNKNNDMNVNQAIAPLGRLGYREIDGPGRSDTPAQREARQQSYYKALARPEQARFREALLIAYDRKCAVSGCTIPAVLEAAHVVPFRSKGENTLANGILLRIDLHRLFDADELAINPETLIPTFSDAVVEHYKDIPPATVRLPLGGPRAPDFSSRWKVFKSA